MACKAPKGHNANEGRKKVVCQTSYRLEYHSLLDQLGWTIEVHHLEVGRRLGEGGFGEFAFLEIMIPSAVLAYSLSM